MPATDGYDRWVPHPSRSVRRVGRDATDGYDRWVPHPSRFWAKGGTRCDRWVPHPSRSVRRVARDATDGCPILRVLCEGWDAMTAAPQIFTEILQTPSNVTE